MRVLKLTYDMHSIHKIMTSWMKHHWAVLFVDCAVILGILDSYFTNLLIMKMGIEHEINPLVKLFYGYNLQIFWVIINIVSMAIFAMFITGFRITIGFRYRANLLFSGLFAVRTAFVLYYYGLLYAPDYYRWFMLWAFMLSSIVVYYTLKSGDSLSIANFKSWLDYHYERFNFWLLTRKISKKSKTPEVVSSKEIFKTKVNKWAITKYSVMAVTFLFAIPIAIQIVVPLLWPSYSHDPSRIFGAFTIYSASAFLAAFVIIIIGIMGIMYSILRLIEQSFITE